MTCFLLWVSSSSWLQNNQAFFLHVDLPQNMKIFVLLLPKDFTLHSSRSLAMWLHWKGKWVVFLTASPVLTLIHSVASEILHFAKTIPRRNPVTFIASNLTFLRRVDDRLWLFWIFRSLIPLFLNLHNPKPINTVVISLVLTCRVWFEPNMCFSLPRDIILLQLLSLFILLGICFDNDEWIFLTATV